MNNGDPNKCPEGFSSGTLVFIDNNDLKMTFESSVEMKALTFYRDKKKSPKKIMHLQYCCRDNGDTEDDMI